MFLIPLSDWKSVVPEVEACEMRVADGRAVELVLLLGDDPARSAAADGS